MDELVEVAFVGDEFQGSIIQALLEENGIPSVYQQTGPSGPLVAHAFLNPGGGPRRIMVHAHRAEEARALLAEAEAAGEEEETPEPDAAT